MCYVRRVDHHVWVVRCMALPDFGAGRTECDGDGVEGVHQLVLGKLPGVAWGCQRAASTACAPPEVTRIRWPHFLNAAGDVGGRCRNVRNDILGSTVASCWCRTAWYTLTAVFSRCPHHGYGYGYGYGLGNGSHRFGEDLFRFWHVADACHLLGFVVIA